MEFNIARIARDLHNKVYENKLDINSFIEISEPTKKEPTQVDFDNNMEIMRNIYKRAGVYK